MPTNLPSIQMKNPSLFQPSCPCTGTVFADAALATCLLLENLQQLSACLSGFDRKTAPLLPLFCCKPPTRVFQLGPSG